MLKPVFRKITHDSGFIPCKVNNGDEIYRNGVFEFNISRLKEYILLNPEIFPVEQIKIADFIQFSKINQSHLEVVNESEPVIIAEIAPGRYNLIDGNHRAVKAERLNKKHIFAYRVGMELHLQFITNKEVYSKYVNYWNSKINEK